MKLRHGRSGLSVAAIIATTLAAIVASPADAQSITLKPGAIEGKELYLKKARDYAYCEIAPVMGTPPAVVAQFYNTTLTTGKTGGCPAKAFAAIDGKALAAAVGGLQVYMNPTPQTARRHWVMDQLWVFKTGETVDFMGVAANWVASMSPEQMKAGLAAPYTGAQINRESKYLYAKGSTVFLMHDPDGKTWVMQSYATEVNKDLTFKKLPKLGSMLHLPTGFTFEAKKLTKDLTIDPRLSAGVAHIVRDDLHDVYEGCGFDAACSYVP